MEYIAGSICFLAAAVAMTAPTSRGHGQGEMATFFNVIGFVLILAAFIGDFRKRKKSNIDSAEKNQ